MKLSERLDEIREGAKKRIPEHLRTQMLRATSELQESGISDNVLKEGDVLPSFRLMNMSLKPVSSKELLEQGPLVLTFYRGVW